MNTATAVLEARFALRVCSGDRHCAVEVNLTLPAGLLVLYGPSGAGKTLTLRVLAGLLRPTSGWLRVGSHTQFDLSAGLWVPPEQRRVGYVPQHNSLFPFLDVRSNVGFGIPKRAPSSRLTVEALLEELGLTSLADARPHQLSGGERQRVALARALACQPAWLLLDEPFAAADPERRESLRKLVGEVIRRRGIPAVMVTHDPEDARALGDTLVRVDNGRTTTQTPPTLAPVLALANARLRSGGLRHR